MLDWNKVEELCTQYAATRGALYKEAQEKLSRAPKVGTKSYRKKLVATVISEFHEEDSRLEAKRFLEMNGYIRASRGEEPK